MNFEYCLQFFPRRGSAEGPGYLNGLKQDSQYICKATHLFLKINGDSCRLAHKSRAETRLGSVPIFYLLAFAKKWAITENYNEHITAARGLLNKLAAF